MTAICIGCAIWWKTHSYTWSAGVGLLHAMRKIPYLFLLLCRFAISLSGAPPWLNSCKHYLVQPNGWNRNTSTWLFGKNGYLLQKFHSNGHCCLCDLSNFLVLCYTHLGHSFQWLIQLGRLTLHVYHCTECSFSVQMPDFLILQESPYCKNSRIFIESWQKFAIIF